MKVMCTGSASEGSFGMAGRSLILTDARQCVLMEDMWLWCGLGLVRLVAAGLCKALLSCRGSSEFHLLIWCVRMQMQRANDHQVADVGSI
jgi:hypothetical protein